MTSPKEAIYFDHNATTAVSDDCLEAMVECLRLGALNPSSKHAAGERARQLVSDARSSLAGALGASAPEIVFTSSGTEANHLAIVSALALCPGRQHVITSEVEHPSTLQLFRTLEGRGIRVSYLPVDPAGRLSLEALSDALRPDTALVSLMWANNETGVLFPIAPAAEMARAHGALFHTDAVQAVGKLAVDLQRAPVDLLALSGHKLHAPAGVGALYVRKGIKLPPLICGHQERGRRGGTENVAGIVALGVAARSMHRSVLEEAAQISRLRDRLEAGVLALAPGATVNGAGASRLSNTSNICLGAVEAEVVLARLERLGIYASAGAACSSAGTKPSHVLMAMGRSASAALGSVRLSLGRGNTEDEVDELLRVLPGVLEDVVAQRTMAV